MSVNSSALMVEVGHVRRLVGRSEVSAREVRDQDRDRMSFYRRRRNETYLCYYDQGLMALIDDDVEEEGEGEEGRGREDVRISTLALSGDVRLRVCMCTFICSEF